MTVSDRSVVITLTVLLAIQPVCCTQSTYYVKPTPDTLCPSESCLTLSEYAQGSGPFFTSNTTMVFLPGDHRLYNDMGITNITTFTMVGDATTLPEITSNIVCTGPAAFIFQNISYLKIHALELSYCGSATLAAMQVSAIPQFELSNSAFYNSRNNSLEATGSGLTITETRFHGSSSTGLSLSRCTAEFLGRNVFSNNLRSGVQSYKSIIRFTGSTTFVNNSGTYGGGMLALNTRIHCIGQCTTFTEENAEIGGKGRVVSCDGEMNFVQNSAEYGGGICALYGSDLRFSGHLTFTNNWAIGGGGIHVENSSLSSEGLTSFISNSAEFGGGVLGTDRSQIAFSQNTSFTRNTAKIGGGGIRLQDSMLSCKGLTSFVNNSAHLGGGIAGSGQVTISDNTSFISNTAEYGGGIFVVDCNVSVNGYTSFVDNSAHYGGGLSAQESTVTSEGFHSFIDNSATLFGGGIRMLSSRMNSEGLLSFVNNSAEYGGGIAGVESQIIFSENTSFFSNIAQVQGGGMFIENGSVSLKGYSNFVKNVATLGGGIAADESIVTCDGLHSFINNSAAAHGGGIHLRYIKLSCEGIIKLVHNSANSGGGILAYRSQVTFKEYANSTDNTAQCGGRIAVKEDCRIHSIECVIFSYNIALFGGGLYSFNSTVDFCKGSNVFTHNSASFGGGVLVTTYTDLTVSGTSTFYNNTAKYSGGAVHIQRTSQVTSYGNATLFHNSARYGAGIYVNNGNFTVARKTYLYSNNATNGGGIYGTMATITINGNMTFEGNSAMTNGGGLSLSSSSQCFLAANGTMYLVNNHAEQYGGAIYVADDPSLYCSTSNVNLWERCFFQLQTLSDTNFTCIIENNSAVKGGSAVYGGMVDRCRLEQFTYFPGEIFDMIFHITEHNITSSAISSDPYQVCPCSNGQPDCSTYSISITVYPGETFLVPVVAVGQRNGTVPAVVKSSLEDEQSMFDSLQRAQSANNTCTALQYTIYSKSSKETMTLEAEGPCLEMGELLIINITLLQCPTGFMLSNSTKGCTCEKRLQKYTNNCNINSHKIDRDGEFWVGVDSCFGGTILHPHCPFDYCKPYPVSFALNEADLECSYDRTGLLCGGCQPGLSNVLGSSRCIKCSSAFLSLLIPFALAGIALVAFLIASKMTVTVGSINGLTFYANIIAVNHSVFLPSGQRNVLTIFIAWLNLDLGIETCFYDGMDAYARAWLQFAFPLYVWVLVGTIVILSHYYSTIARMFGRNPIAVLATLFLLSYAKLLRTIIAVLSFTYLEYPDGAEVAVWLYDGNVRYLKGKHIPLFLTALLVLLLLFLPYTLLLLFGQWIQAHSEKRIFSWISNYQVKPFLDAYHAPYRDEYRYWPGLLLVLRCILFLVFAFNILGNPNVNLFVISVCITALLILTRFTGKVYANQYLDAIDASYLLNIGVLASGTLYVRSVGGRQEILAYTSLSIAFTTFLGILVYQVSAQIRGSRLWKETIWPTLQGMRQRTSISLHRDFPDTDSQGAEPEIVGAHASTTTYINLRELLLEDNN